MPTCRRLPLLLLASQDDVLIRLEPSHALVGHGWALVPATKGNTTSLLFFTFAVTAPGNRYFISLSYSLVAAATAECKGKWQLRRSR
jgi:hypothetical protein